MDGGLNQDKYFSLLRRLQECTLGDFIFITNSLGKLGDILIHDVIRLSTKRSSEEYRILRKVKRDIFKLKMYQFMNYSKLLEEDCLTLFKKQKKKYEAFQVKEKGEFVNTITETVYTQGSLKNLCLTRIGDRTIAKLSFARGISIQVYAENNKLYLSSYLW